MNSGSHDSMPDLSPRDAALLDRLIEVGFEAEALEPLTDEERARAAQLQQLFGLLEDYPVDEPDPALIDATMIRISRAEEERTVRMRIGPDEGRERRLTLPIRLPDFVTVAAVLLIGASILWPVMSTVRQRAIDTGCANNMRMMSQAFELYAEDHDGFLPTVRAGFGVGGWEQFRNVLNLSPLVEHGYCDHGHVNCPGNHDSYAPPFSYQFQRPDRPMKFGRDAPQVLLGDRNPLIDAATSGRAIPPLSVSLNHGGRGQNVVRLDGAVQFLEVPRIAQDNIWLPSGADELNPGMAPADSRDSFLAH